MKALILLVAIGVAVTLVRRKRYALMHKGAALANARAATQALHGQGAVEVGAEGGAGPCFAPLEDGSCGRGAELDAKAGCCACDLSIPQGGVCPRGFYSGERCCLQCARPVPGDGVCPEGMEVSEGCCVRQGMTTEEMYGELAAGLVEEAVVMLAADKVLDMVARKVFKETIKEGSERAVREAGDKAASKAFKEAMKNGTTKGLEETMEKAVKEATDKAAKSAASKAVGKTVAKEVAERAAREAIEAGAEAVIKESMDKAAKEAAQKTIKDMGKKAAKEAIEKAVKEATEKAAKEAADLAVREISQRLGKEVAEKVASTMATKAGASIAAKSTAAAAKAAKAAITAAKVGKAGAAASRGMASLTKLTNPMTAALVVFDLASLTVDLLDVSGYSNFTANAVNENARNVAEMSAQDMCLELKIDYPQLFPPEMAFPDEWATALTAMQSEFITDAISQLMDKDDESGDDISEDEVIKLLGQLINKDPKRRDQLIYDALVTALKPVDRKRVQLYKQLSTKTRVAVSLSEEGAKWWNSRYKGAWFGDFNSPEKAGDPKPLALYSRKYRVLADQSWFAKAKKNRKAMEVMKNMPSFGGAAPPDVGTLENPKVKEKTLAEAAPMALSMAPTQNLVALCEAKKNEKNIFGGSVNDGVDPKSFGVTFDLTTGVCTYTRSYCERFALEFRESGNTDCVPYPGQGAAELVFGTEITRAFVKIGQEFEKAFGSDLVCDDKDEDQFGLGCWKKPEQGWSWTTPGIAGSEFKGLDCPSFSNTLAAHCHYDRGAGVAQVLKPCPVDTRDIGTDCYYHSKDRGGTYADVYHANTDHYGKDDFYNRKPTLYYDQKDSHKIQSSDMFKNEVQSLKNDDSYTGTTPTSKGASGYNAKSEKWDGYSSTQWGSHPYYVTDRDHGDPKYDWSKAVWRPKCKDDHRRNVTKCEKKTRSAQSSQSVCESKHGRGNCEYSSGKYYHRCDKKYGRGWYIWSGKCYKKVPHEETCKAKHPGGCVSQTWHNTKYSVRKCPSGWTNKSHSGGFYCDKAVDAKSECDKKHNGSCVQQKWGADAYWNKRCQSGYNNVVYSNGFHCEKNTSSRTACEEAHPGRCEKHDDYHVERPPSGYKYSSYSGQYYVTDQQKACESEHGRNNCEAGKGDGHWYKKCRPGYELTAAGYCNDSAMARCERDYGPDSKLKGLGKLEGGRGCEVFSEANIDYVYPKCRRKFGDTYKAGRAHHTICYPDKGEVRAMTLYERMHCEEGSGKTTEGGSGLCYPPPKEVAIRGKKKKFTCRETSCELSREIKYGDWSPRVHTCGEGYTKMGSRCYRNEHLEEKYGPGWADAIKRGAFAFGAGAGKAWDYASGAVTSGATNTAASAEAAASSAGSFASTLAKSIGR